MKKIAHYYLRFFLLLPLLIAGCGDTSKSAPVPHLTLRNIQNSSNVPTNARLYLEFSKNIDAATVTENTFYLLDSAGEKVDGTRTVALNRVTLLPARYLDPLQAYTLIVTKDLLSTEGYGLLQEYQWHFASMQHADTDAPVLRNLLPEDNASVHTEIALQFDEQIHVENNQTTALEVRDASDTPVSGKVSLEYDLLRFSPLSPLALNAAYTVSLTQKVSDLYGNEYNGTASWHFTTAADDHSQPLDERVVNTLETQSPLLSMALVHDTLITGGDESISTYLINPLTCKLSKLQTLTLNAPAYVIKNRENHLLVGSLEGVSILSMATSGEIEQSAFYETDAPVYDIAVNDDTAFLAQTTAGARAIDISQVSQPFTLFDFPNINMATEIVQADTRLYVADNTLQALLAFTAEGAYVEQTGAGGNIYDLVYDDPELYLAMGLNGFGTLSQGKRYAARSFVGKVVPLKHQRPYTLLIDKNRGLTRYDVLGESQVFISYKEGLFNAIATDTCTFLGYENGDLKSVDIFAPYVAASTPSQNGSVTTGKQGIVLNFDEPVRAAGVIKENITFTDETLTPVSYRLDFDNEKTLTLTPETALHVSHQYRIAVTGIEDLYGNAMIAPFVLNFDANYTENITPQAFDDARSMNEDTSLAIAVLDNDVDANGNDTLERTSVHITTFPLHGSVSIDSLGVVTYTPYSNYFGSDTFAYTVRDTGGLTSNIATVSITIFDVYDPPLNQPPVANDDNITVYSKSSTDIDVLGNDTDPDGTIDPATVTITQELSNPSSGSLSVNPTTGVITFSLYSALTYPDTFKYTVKDTEGATSNEALVTINP